MQQRWYRNMNNKLLLGVSREIINPEIGCNLYGYNPNIYSTSINDDLTATAFAFSYGDTKAAIVSATVCTFSVDLSGRIRKLIEAETGIPADNIMICATHTHSGPAIVGSLGWGSANSDYIENVLVPNIVKATKDASEKAVPVKTGIATGESLVGVNRRNLLDSEDPVFGQCTWGAFDPKITVLSFRDYEGNTVGNLVHYGAHATAAGSNTEITRDWPGYMTDRLEFVTGGLTGFVNGCEGNVGPRNTCGCTGGKATIDWAAEVGYNAAADAVRVYKTIPDFTDLDLEVKSDILKLEQLPRMSYDEAKAEYEKLSNDTTNLNGKKHEYYKAIMDSYDNGYVDEEYCDVHQILIRLGNYVFAALPFEPFAEIGLRINQSCPDKNILTLCLTNGSEGYFGTESAMCHGGYEIESFKMNRLQQLKPHADTALVKETLRNISGLKGCESGGGKGWFNKII